MSIHFHSLLISDIRRETNDCISVAFDIPDVLKDTFSFREGQNITLRITINGEELRRSYSICSSPVENELRVAIKAVMDGRFSVYANQTLKKGDRIDALPPTGKFHIHLDSLHKKQYVAFAAGSGITPIISIIKTVLATEPLSEFTLVYGNRNRTSIIFREDLEALKNKYMNRFRVIHILSREITDAPINYGRITADKCEQLGTALINWNNTDHFFLCGPEEMIFTVRDFLLLHGVESTNIHFELFTTPGQKVSEREKSINATKELGPVASVTVKLDGIAFQFDLPYHGSSILDAALKQGADLPYACKGGVCSTCKAKLVLGKVDMDQNYALEPDEIAAGYILTCQSHPRNPELVVDYDMR
ncbi:1,2-phenylacetyl-CoA epoxidase subunit PaaE [Flavihumibacter profundi]|jgi:ring-1,2-phenylacetyl-CoA epoxidase subunit PaaE|uniref:1,2-phenylacetyl-CoA epoxidase subunit PaaE n=1 Tax=Flavihumibacter profundi TaxID=2716883 RepID=UPI001CC5EDE1|nr:1,2-phenylacetyl-CoA epoxidase subunit PaaE [Flavihumibacter profundi]MBZ5858748.1 phenylacetate-CoA oxygenase/reductase subunit PaaK [Flavihumibacter profundi]